MSLKILHTGDIHLGMKFNQYPKINNQLEKARYQVLEKLIIKANEKKSNLFVIAGDLFDKINISDKNIEKTAEILDKFAGDAVIILPGNHDYNDGINSLWSKFEEQLKEKIIILNQEKIFKLDNYNISAAIYPAPCETKLSAENNLAWIKNSAKDSELKYHLLIAHGALAGFSPDLNDNYFKMEKEELLNLDMDLCLLGHSHIAYPKQKEVVNQVIFNSGTPEPDAMDCQHFGSAWFIELNENKNIKAKQLETGIFHFSDLEKEIKSKKDLNKIADSILSSNADKKILRLKLKGELSREEFTEKDNIIRKIRDNCFYSQIDQNQLTIKLDHKSLTDEFSETSFPYQILEDLEDNPEAMYLAYKMLKEVQE